MTRPIYTVFPQEELDAHLARVFATPAGFALLEMMEAGWLVLSAPVVHQAIARARERWSTGGPVRSP